MNRLFLFFFLLLSVCVQGQDIGRTVTEPRLDRTYRPRLDSDNTLKYKPFGLPEFSLKLRAADIINLTDSSGRIMPVMGSLSDFSGATQRDVVYGGSVWHRTPVTATTTNILSTTSIGYGAMFTAPVGGYYYSRVYDGAVNAKWFGARGDLTLPSSYTSWTGLTTAEKAPFLANHDAIQNAITYAARAVIAGTEGPYPRGRNRPNALYIPSGTYNFGGSSLLLYATLHVYGDGGQSLGGTVLRQLTDNQHLFEQKEADFNSAAIQIEDLRLTNIGATGNGVLYFSRSFTASHNSLYLNRVWFQGFSYAAVQIYRTNDPQITNCTFDGGYGKAFILGDNTVFDGVTEGKITGCSFYYCIGGVGELRHVKGLIFSNNTVDNGQVVGNLPGIDAYTNSYYNERIHIVNNTWYGISPLITTKHSDLLMSQNTSVSGATRQIQFIASGVLKGINIQQNKFLGTYNTNVIAGVPDAPIYSYGADLQNSQIKGNTFRDTTGISTTAIYFPNASTINNDFSSNDYIGYSLPIKVNQPGLNSVSFSNTNYIASGNFQTMNLKTGVYALNSAVTGMPYVAPNWIVSILHNEDSGTTGGGPFSRATALNLNNNDVYTGGNLNSTFTPWVKTANITDLSSISATSAPTYTANNIVANGNILANAANGRMMGFQGLSSGMTISNQFGDVNNRVEVTFGLPAVQNWYHGLIVQNAVSGSSGPALTVAGLTGAQPIATFKNSTSATVGGISQAGLLTMQSLSLTGSGVVGSGTTGSTTTVPNLSFGTAVSSTPGLYTKLRLYENGSIIYGLGVSGGELNYVVPVSATHSFFVDGTKRVAIEGSVTRTSNDMYITDYTKGYILRDNGGACWRITVSPAGALQTTSVTCP